MRQLPDSPSPNKDYAHRMTSKGKKPWIGGSRLEYKSREETTAMLELVSKLMAEERGGKRGK